MNERGMLLIFLKCLTSVNNLNIYTVIKKQIVFKYLLCIMAMDIGYNVIVNFG